MLRTVSFGHLKSGIWGAVFSFENDEQGFAVLGERSDGKALDLPASLVGSERAEPWWVSAPGVELEVSPLGEAGLDPGGYDQLVRVRGAMRSQAAIDVLGRRGLRADHALADFDSIRDVSAWFEPDLGFALVAARPHGAAGHAEDVVSASVLEQGHAVAVADPRLSTTYTSAGLPARASFELWLAAEDVDDSERSNDDQDEERPAHFPRRAAGEAVGARGDWRDGPTEVHAELFRWHARGREGAGVYLLAGPSR